MGIYFSKSQQKIVYRFVLQVTAPSSCLCLLNTNILNTDIDSVNLNLFPKLSPSCYLLISFTWLSPKYGIFQIVQTFLVPLLLAW